MCVLVETTLMVCILNVVVVVVGFPIHTTTSGSTGLPGIPDPVYSLGTVCCKHGSSLVFSNRELLTSRLAVTSKRNHRNGNEPAKRCVGWNEYIYIYK